MAPVIATALRLAESLVEALGVLAAVVLPPGLRHLDGRPATVLAGALAVLTCVVYGLHKVTFDCFRLTGVRAAGEISSTQRDP
jgi:hypothetical protein